MTISTSSKLGLATSAINSLPNLPVTEGGYVTATFKAGMPTGSRELTTWITFCTARCLSTRERALQL